MTKYIVILTNGQTIAEENLDLKTIQAEMNKQTTIAIKIGRKAYAKQMIKLIVNEENTKQDGHNVGMVVGRFITYNTADDVDKAIEQVTEAVNLQNWVLFNETILFNSHAFEYIETLEAVATVEQ